MADMPSSTAENPALTSGVSPSVSTALANDIYAALEKMLEPRLVALEQGLVSASDYCARLEEVNRELHEDVVSLAAARMGRAPKVNPPTVYDGKDTAKADLFLHQTTVAAKFENFSDDVQKILWAQSYLSGQAQLWSVVVTTSLGAEYAAAHTTWTGWVEAFKQTFCSRNVAREALQQLNQLHQGSNSITHYTTQFRELVAKLPAAEQTGNFIDNRYWEGLSLASKQNLVGTDFVTAAQAQEILLRRESRLADISAQVQRTKGATQFRASAGTSQLPNSQSASISATGAAPRPAQAQASLPLPPRDPNAMDVDGARPIRTCFRCGEAGHVHSQCTGSLEKRLKAAIVEELSKKLVPAAAVLAAPEAGFV